MRAGDIVTAQLIRAGPRVLLYFLSVALSWLVARRRSAPADGSEATLPPPEIDGGEHA